uniref:Globin family profile domain-containing protein n=1 Tax=Acrobeloides nanus TaxID=290746 RepID=A0A914C4R8_9BILA
MLLKATWSDEAEDLSNLGIDIYMYIFENNPHVRTLFPKIHQHWENWRSSKEVEMQGYLFATTLARVIENIDNIELTRPFLYKIGARHVAYAKRGFRRNYWEMFQDGMACVMTNRIFNSFNCHLDRVQKNDAVATWKKLAVFVINNLKEGFDSASAIAK